MKRYWILALIVVLSLTGFTACRQERITMGPKPVVAGSVRIHMDADTLNFLPGDSVRCNGWVVVKDRNGNALPDVPVSITLDRSFGFLDFVDPQRRDTTDATGTVNFRFMTYNQSGENTVIAAVGDLRDTWPLVVRVALSVRWCVTVTLSPDTLLTDGIGPDSVHVDLWIFDNRIPHVGIPRVSILLPSCGGRFSGLPATDSTGHAEGYFYCNFAPGLFCYPPANLACDGDTACVVVIDTSAHH
jgi:hypothetical protein